MKFRLVQIELTNRCNFDCPFCFRKKMTREQGDMTEDTFKASLKLVKSMKIPEVWLHNWGEPLLHPDIVKFINMAKQLKVGFTTNGKLLSKDLILELKKAGLSCLDISINMDTNKFSLIHLLKSYTYANTHGLDCHLRCVVQNSAEYLYLKDLLLDYKVRWQRVMLRTGKRKEPCQAVNHVFVIQWDGTIVPCCHVINKEITYGTLSNPAINITNLNDYCNNCSEINEEMPVKWKL
jgi:sulfatase maturation enzyme AslB (radical SAM superfamily)